MGTIPHSLLQAELAFWFRSHQVEWAIRVLTEVRTRTSPQRVRLPDVAVVRDDNVLREQIRSTAPLIVIEILSLEDRWNRIIPRLDEFVAIGVEHVWILDPTDRAAYTYTPQGVKLVHETRLNLPDSPIHLDLPQIFAALGLSSRCPCAQRVKRTQYRPSGGRTPSPICSCCQLIQVPQLNLLRTHFPLLSSKINVPPLPHKDPHWKE